MWRAKFTTAKAFINSLLAGRAKNLFLFLHGPGMKCNKLHLDPHGHVPNVPTTRVKFITLVPHCILSVE